MFFPIFKRRHRAQRLKAQTLMLRKYSEILKPSAKQKIWNKRLKGAAFGEFRAAAAVDIGHP